MPNFTSTSEASQSGGIKFLVHGPAGVGKTMLAGTLPDPVILATKGEGVLSLSEANQRRVFGDARDIPVILIEKPTDITDALKYLKTDTRGKQFESVILDSVSDMFAIQLTGLKIAFKDPRQAYGELYDKGLGMIRDFKALPAHVLFVATQEKEKDEETGKLLWMASAPGKSLTKDLPYMFDEVFAMQIHANEKGEKLRWLLTQLTPQFSAKDRSGALDEYEEPNLSAIIDKIRNTSA